uniref:CCHC-type domain-containing protein n=1 Tax=Trypanosoma congolense (strain IL3000) TaxID=1068625 RepID=G0UQ92_TRYCI|nr:conserved hypothetical protein [Trypanosoma congolense IL3000]
MSSHQVNEEFLHRCCIQVSSPLTDDVAIESEIQHTLCFVREHARMYSKELAQSLVWRIADTDDDEFRDRLGAWQLLNAVLKECADTTQQLSCTTVAEKINNFLPHIISHRWCSAYPRSSREVSVHRGIISRARHISERTNDFPASTLVDTPRSISELKKLMCIKNREFLATWKTVWRDDVYQRHKKLVRLVESNGNEPLRDPQSCLHIPYSLRDSLRRLRRMDPRPSIAHDVLRCYGWKPLSPAVAANETPSGDANGSSGGAVAQHMPYGGAATSNGAYARSCLPVPQSTSEIEALDPATHPRVRQWLRRLVEARGGCPRCDMWLHTELRCPCEQPFLRFPPCTESGQHHSYRQSYYYRLTQTEYTDDMYLESAKKLFRYGIRLPLSYENVLDRIVKLIRDETPYEELLTAFDTVRGATTGPRERHALWLHASYRLMPSRTVFGKPNDESLSSSMEKVRNLFKKSRRFREWDKLLQSVEVLDIHFRRAALPAEMRQSIKEIRDTNSFFFCLVDGSLPPQYAPEAYACTPKDVELLRPVKDILCANCLEPFHTANRCTKTREPWDLSVARSLLKEHNLLNVKGLGDPRLLDSALRAIDAGDRKAKEFRKDELRLAVKLVHDNQVPYCKVCDIMGHGTRLCKISARRTLQDNNIKEIDMRLQPTLVMKRIQQLQMNGNDREAQMLSDAWDVLGKGKAYPEGFHTAIREIRDARIPLAAARYSTDAVQGFLLHVKSSDLLQHLSQLEEENFPDVCLFCDSYYHSSAECTKADPEERGFLCEVRRHGMTLWQYLRTPKWYDEHFPTDFVKGRETIAKLAQQFSGDYSPGGIGRERFMEQNGFFNDPSNMMYGCGVPQISSALTGHSPVGRDGIRIPYSGTPLGTSLSQLVCPAKADSREEQVYLGTEEAGARASATVSSPHKDSSGHRLPEASILGDDSYGDFGASFTVEWGAIGDDAGKAPTGLMETGGESCRKRGREDSGTAL